MHEYVERVIEFMPKLVEALSETSIMLVLAALIAILLGIPLGTYLYLSSSGKPLENRWLNRMLNLLVNIIRSFPFLLLIVVMQPLVRHFYGRATGDPVAASFPLMLIAMALYARFVEQSFHELGPDILETAMAMGASLHQTVRYFLLVEARSSLIIGFTTAAVSFVSYSTVMGAVGGGGIGDFAIRYGYQRYETDIMYTAILIIIVMVQLFQWLGLSLARRFDKRHIN